MIPRIQNIGLIWGPYFANQVVYKIFVLGLTHASNCPPGSWFCRYLREVQNQARADGMNAVALAKAEQHGWRPLNQYAMSSAIPVTKQDNTWSLAQRDYRYVVQHVSHYLPMTIRGEGR